MISSRESHFHQLIREITTVRRVHQPKRDFITGIRVSSANSRNNHGASRSSAKTGFHHGDSGFISQFAK